jgi:hypothetical protein
MTRQCFGGGVLLLVLAAFGCGSGTGQVTGKVTYKGQPLPSGTVLFHGPARRIDHAVIASDGTYTIPDVPVGPVKIAVKSHSKLPPGMFKAAGKAPYVQPLPKELPPEAKFIPIPERYSDPDRSGLECLVQGGRQTHDLTLQP